MYALKLINMGDFALRRLAPPRVVWVAVGKRSEENYYCFGSVPYGIRSTEDALVESGRRYEGQGRARATSYVPFGTPASYAQGPRRPNKMPASELDV